MKRGWAAHGNGQPLLPVEAAIPQPVGTEVVLETSFCGVCHSDLYLQDGYYDLGGGQRMPLADRGVKLPVIPGHETVGRVVALGPDANGVRIGDHRLVYPWAGCGDCPRCVSGEDHMCPQPHGLGVFRDGGYGTHVVVARPEHLIDFGDIDPALAATYACSGITAYSAVRKLRDVPTGDPVVVVGAGGLGLAAISILSALRYERIVAVDIGEAKLAGARDAGAGAAVDGRSQDLPGDIARAAGGPVYGVVDFVSSSGTAAAAVAMLARGGTYVSAGLFGGELTVQLSTLLLRAITIRGSYTGSRADLRELIDLARSGKLRPVPVERVPHADPNGALDRMRSGDVAGRLVLDAGLHPPMP